MAGHSYQEKVKPQSDSLTAVKKGFKLLIEVAAKKRGFMLALIDIQLLFSMKRF